jgi:large subunit ribosomal protein L2
MAKRIISQRRGRGTSTYRAPPRKFRPELLYKNDAGKVVDIISDPARNSPLAKVEYSDKSKGYLVAAEGVRVGDSLEAFAMPIAQIGEGSQIFAIETYPNSGPKLCRTSGSFATVLSKGVKTCIIQLPSKKKKKLNIQCKASIGIPAGEGRRDKPWIKAGKKSHAMRARGKLYPRTSGVAMNAVDHPFGGGGSGKVRPPVSGNAPPGRKVGSVSPKRTGRKKRK